MSISEDAVVRLATLAIYNASIIIAARRMISADSIRSAMKEKAAPDTGTPPGQELPASYSRISGGLGALVMASFLWALGNHLLYAMMTGGGEAAVKTLDSLTSYFLAGSALFAPYAFNQLKEVFRDPAKTK